MYCPSRLSSARLGLHGAYNPRHVKYPKRKNKCSRHCAVYLKVNSAIYSCIFYPVLFLLYWSDYPLWFLSIVSMYLFLKVMHFNDGHLSITGCVEHTGHRLGTALLRLNFTIRVRRVLVFGWFHAWFLNMNCRVYCPTGWLTRWGWPDLNNKKLFSYQRTNVRHVFCGSFLEQCWNSNLEPHLPFRA